MNTWALALRRLVVHTAVAALAGVVSSAGAQTLVDITNGPLYSGLQPHPNVVVAASVEFPTVGAAYIAANQTYDRTQTYVGYFDPARCYVGVASLTYPAGSALSGFTWAALADSNHECSAGNQFSGNFMNWVTMSAIDEFRYALTGGNRIIDTTGVSVLERAYLPDGTIPGLGGAAPGSSPAGDTYFYGGALFPTIAACDSTASATGCSFVYPGSLQRIMPAGVAGSGKVYVANCGTVVYFGSASSTGSCLSPGTTSKDRGVYHVAVGVCDITEGPARTDLCQLYGALYKPVGVAQQHAADMRFASFGYLMDTNAFVDNPLPSAAVPSKCLNVPDLALGWNACRYGGVLRSPMKYLGASSYDANQVASTNFQAEINPLDGTFILDPEKTNASTSSRFIAAAVGGANSGFIAYINKFGQTGLYKRFDPIGELWYEALRYLSGLPPTKDAMAGNVTNNVLDHYPTAYTNAAGTAWGDPLANQTTCSANYIVSIGDGSTNYDTYLPGDVGIWNGFSQRDKATNITYTNTDPLRLSGRAVDEHGLDARLWTQRIGNLESSSVTTLSTNDHDPALAGLQDKMWNAYAGPLVSGAAFWANVNDIRPSGTPEALPGKQTVTSIAVDVNAQEGAAGYPYPLQSVPTYERQLYLMGKYGGFVNTIDQSSDAYPNPFYASDLSNPNGPAVRSNREWADSTGSPSNYILASDPAKLISGIRAAFNRISATAGSIAGAGLSVPSLAYGSGYAYLSTFDPKYWSGTVQARQVSQSGGVVSVSSTALWDAGALLTAYCGGSPTTTNRCNEQNGSSRNLITTLRYGIGAQRSASPFVHYNGCCGVALDPQVAALFNTDPATGLVDNNAFYRVQFLRGDRRGESGPFLIPPFTVLNFRARSSIMGDVVNSGSVYVAAPTTAIADADYVAFYNTYQNRTAAVYVGANDGMMHAFNAANGNELFGYIPNLVYYDLTDLTNPNYTHETFVDSTPAVKEAKVNGNWKTVLVSGVGNGGQGVFALDVSDPASFGKANVIFEFSDADDPDMGNVLSAPEIVKLQTGTTGSPAVPTYGYFAAVTGYNNRRTTANNRTDSNVSTYTDNRGVLFLLSLDRTLGTSWVLGSNYYKFNFPANSTTKPNGLGPVASLIARDGSGTAQALYFGDLQGDLWRLNTVGPPSAWTPSRGSVSAPSPLFVAVDATTSMNRQPITVRPQIAIAPFNSQLVIFGTGEYLGKSDLSGPYAQQSEYALLDNNQGTLITRSTDLATRVGAVSGTNVSITGSAFTYSGSSSKRGWVLDFPSILNGERNVTRAAVNNNLLSFTSLTLPSDICGVGGGYVYQLNALTGLPYVDSLGNVIPGGAFSTVGIPGPPQVVDLSIAPGLTKATGEQIGQKTSTTLVSGSSGSIAGAQTNITSKAPPVGRVNWREVTNYNDRH